MSVCACVSLAFSLNVAQSAVHLPTPSGPNAIGTEIFSLVDSTRKDLFGPNLDAKRPLGVQVWYPAVKTSTGAQVPYFQPAVLDEMESANFQGVRHSTLQAWERLLTHAKPNAAIDGAQPHPLAIFSPGFGMPRSFYTSLVEDMASHGWIVAVIDHPYAGITVVSDGRVLTSKQDADHRPDAASRRVGSMSLDQSFVLNAINDGKSQISKFRSSIDSKRIVVLGHALGGSASLETALRDSRFAGAADLGGSVFGRVENEGLGKRSLIFLDQPVAARPSRAVELERAQKAEWDQVIGKTEGGSDIALVRIDGASHFSFTDAPFVAPQLVASGPSGSVLRADRMLKVIGSTLDSFFLHCFAGDTGTQMVSNDLQFPEETFEIIHK